MKQRPSWSESERRRRNKLQGWPLPFAFLLAMALVHPLARGQSTGVISGRVTNSQGQLQGVLVHLLAEGDIPAGNTYSDSKGDFVFMGLSNGEYAVVVEAEGYKPFRGAARLDNIIQPRAQVMVMLEIAATQPDSKGVLVTGSKSNSQLSAKRPMLPFDAKAVKEFDKGNKEQQQGNVQAALEHYQRALRIDANFFPTLNNMGTIIERQGKHVEAQAAFVGATQINPEDGQAYINLGHVLYEEGQFRPAVDRLIQGVQRSPESAVANFFLGSAYFKLYEPDKAEPLLKKACALDPRGMAPAHVQLTNLYLQCHEYRAAKAQLETYLRINPSDPQALGIKRMLADIAKDSRQ